jgi:hypothetical protein
LSASVESALWLATALAIAGASALLLAGTSVACSRGGLRRALLALSALRFAALAVWTATHREYLVLGLDAALGTLLVLALLARAARRGAFRGLAPVAGGIFVGLGGALLRELGVAPHSHFNENDLYHVLQVVSLWLLYRGGRELRQDVVVASAP